MRGSLKSDTHKHEGTKWRETRGDKMVGNMRGQNGGDGRGRDGRNMRGKDGRNMRGKDGKNVSKGNSPGCC